MLNRILPFDVLNLILEYDGRIKYIHKDRIYVNIISKYDYRYNAITPKINKQNELTKQFNIENNGLKFYINIYYKNDDIYTGLILSKKLLHNL